MNTIVIALAERIADTAIALGMEAEQDPPGRMLPAEAIAELREALASLERARQALARSVRRPPR